MKKAVHFGAGNIGRGFIGEILSKNGFEIYFVDTNKAIIDELNTRHSYEIGIASSSPEKISVSGLFGINNGENPEDVIEAIAQADIVTKAIGPNILPYIAELVAKGIQKRKEENKQVQIDIIACENMIGGSEFLEKKVAEYLSDSDKVYLANYIGFPNAAVDRIVPGQKHEDLLYVEVEPFCEWVIDESQIKNKSFKLEGVHYANNLEPFIERKLFSVNSGHATVAYSSAYKGYKIILEGLQHKEILSALKGVQKETRALLLAKWPQYFTEEDLMSYHQMIISRFANPKIIDEVTRVARTPIRKLGYDERFIRPIRELNERGLSYQNHLDIVGKIFAYQDENDSQSVQLQEKLSTMDLQRLIEEVTGLSNKKIILEIELVIKKYKNDSK
ncbi:D-mannitol 1-phosphate 5-dehydrogenase [Lactococcus cremoris subsp. cremoris SK11]|uniref:Mannitol-1-phosphate 5-dehydrogenase n=2 Tax=Lactococcus lactis subsp. cremoris TaxID=1359 RepID=MTLD_LACLS|nr:mannitol-1-phosphate 5-dehydrogenase [Lactococcus cremoris]Q033G3.1 RecName: Full=Mannitol-1-phosphate 5-dehydrogenase [Lactococcus cremoris subsp. cremoris SK11]ABJ71659.1 D-mannitol 1-phosphate 5-dehydrogenase [Lactococcus cremoris subsp. cremoris SK11]ARE22248.1 mannitol-1-phosphate 5-dehydrogenase [Lactococcus cremoris]KZK47067.1 Mannitol-1-phosphate 5-dehydrogenase [Lactococcus cremoris]KZK53905.1 Mannitol-1-phosphate 5-dehydrogenase [Lactococcus cremoris]MCT4409312.1 mannitol-1-phosp